MICYIVVCMEIENLNVWEFWENENVVLVFDELVVENMVLYIWER